MDLTEVFGFATGAICVWLAVRQNVWTFPVGLANNLAFLVLFTGAGLYANAALQVLFAVIGGLGWYWWTRRGPDGGALLVRRTPRWAWVAAAGATAVLTVAGLLALSAWTDSAVPFWDSLTTSTSVVAQLMLGRKWLGNWAVWIGTDVILIGLYATQGLLLTAALYVGYLAMCVVGVRQWRRARDRAAAGPEASDEAVPPVPTVPTVAATPEGSGRP